MEEKKSKTGTAVDLVLVLAGFVALGVLGGSWRTELTFRPSGGSIGADVVRFEERWTASHFVCGLIRGEQKDLATVLANHIHEGQRLVEISITTKLSLSNILLGMVTLGIYTPNTVEVRGLVNRADAQLQTR